MSEQSIVSWCAWYLFESGGDVTYFHQHRKATQRVGQAFCNALTEQDRAKVIGKTFDPFYDDENLPAALEALTGVVRQAPKQETSIHSEEN